MDFMIVAVVTAIAKTTVWVLGAVVLWNANRVLLQKIHSEKRVSK